MVIENETKKKFLIDDLEEENISNIDFEIKSKDIVHIDDQLSRKIFHMRYIDKKRWRDIARELNYSTSNIYKLHKKAIDIYRDRFSDVKALRKT